MRYKMSAFSCCVSSSPYVATYGRKLNAFQKQKIHMEKLKAGELSKDQLTDKEQLQLEEQEQHQKGLLAKSLQEEGEEELYKIKHISSQGPLQPIADDDSDMADIMTERFPEDEKDGSKHCLKKYH